MRDRLPLLIGLTLLAVAIAVGSLAIAGGIRDRNRNDVITVTGFALWTLCGVFLRQWPLVASNLICFFLSGFILAMKLLPRSKKRRVGRSIEKTLH